MNKAYFLKNVQVDYGNGKAYRLSSPLDGHNHIIVASFIAPGYMGEPMTMIYPSNEDGEIVSWKDLSGSQVGILSCERVLFDIGYVEEVCG